MPATRVNPRLAKLHRAYSVPELAALLGAHPHTVRGWIKAGLPTVDCTRPVLIHGIEFQEWWAKRRKVAQRPLQPGQLYCFKCREPRPPALGMVDYDPFNATSGNLKALCTCCATPMHRRTRLASIAATMPGCDVRILEGETRLGAIQPLPVQASAPGRNRNVAPPGLDANLAIQAPASRQGSPRIAGRTPSPLNTDKATKG